LWFVRSDPQSADPNLLRSPFSGALFTGETSDGVRLQTSSDGGQLILFEQPRSPLARGTLRIYDVRPEWIERVLGQRNALSESELVSLACNILRQENSTPALREVDATSDSLVQKPHDAGSSAEDLQGAGTSCALTKQN